MAAASHIGALANMDDERPILFWTGEASAELRVFRRLESGQHDRIVGQPVPRIAAQKARLSYGTFPHAAETTSPHMIAAP